MGRMRGRRIVVALAVLAGAAAGSPRGAAADPAPPPAAQVRLIAGGDLAFGRYYGGPRYQRVSSAADPLAGLAGLLHGADLGFANLECPLAAEPARFELTRSHTDPDGASLSLRAEPGDARLLAAAGFTHLSIANNHALDMGGTAARETRDRLAAAGLVGVGGGDSAAEAARPVVVSVRGVKVALLARTVWLRHRDDTGGWAVALADRDRLDDLAAEVTRVKAATGADFLVLSLHWGWELEEQPRAAQVAAAHALVDAGADVILGHHPHVLQTVERYHGGVIAYSLGNLLFDQRRRVTRFSALLELTFDAAAHTVVPRLHPVIADVDSRVPALARGAAYRRWAAALRRLAPGIAVAAAPARVAPDRQMVSR